MKLNSFSQIIKSKKGMTLIEIMIVLAILGGLMTVLATQVTKQLGKAKVREATIAMGELSKAIEMFYTDCGYYPKELGNLINEDSECSSWGPESYVKNDKRLKDPWNTEFIYEVSGSSYVIRSLGADRRDGGAGNDKDISSDEI
jgi:general secretion pathway protein G